MTGYQKDLTFNLGRQIAYDSLAQTIDACYGKSGITEKYMHDLWFKTLSAKLDVAPDGWYSPPPLGMAVLFGAPAPNSRINFDSLRDSVNQPSERVINWQADLFYAYASPVHIATGLPGDVQVTLYFGQDEKIINHFKNTRAAAEQVFSALGSIESSGALFQKSQEVFKSLSLRSNVVSKTDVVSLNLGHSLPVLTGIENGALTLAQKDYIRTARGFLNAASDWAFTDGLQFTIEPQLVSAHDSAMPQVTFHYIAQKKAGKAYVCTDVDTLLKRFGLM